MPGLSSADQARVDGAIAIIEGRIAADYTIMARGLDRTELLLPGDTRCYVETLSIGYSRSSETRDANQRQIVYQVRTRLAHRLVDPYDDRAGQVVMRRGSEFLLDTSLYRTDDVVQIQLDPSRDEMERVGDVMEFEADAQFTVAVGPPV